VDSFKRVAEEVCKNGAELDASWGKNFRIFGF
jgi:hypothetical protein